jgi:hypothetical protein
MTAVGQMESIAVDVFDRRNGALLGRYKLHGAPVPELEEEAVRLCLAEGLASAGDRAWLVGMADLPLPLSRGTSGRPA